MKEISKPKKEEEILAAVDKKANKDKIMEEVVAKAECCVVHLCGCK
jgi:hypothetical protein